jgi:hypothetical protein
VTLHNEIHLKANSYVKLPIRFVPIAKGCQFNVDLIGRVVGTGNDIRIILTGQAN